MTTDRYGRPISVAQDTINEWEFWHQWAPAIPIDYAAIAPPPLEPTITYDTSPSSPEIQPRRVRCPWAIDDDAPNFDPSGQYAENWYRRNPLRAISDQVYNLPALPANYQEMQARIMTNVNAASFKPTQPAVPRGGPARPTGSQTTRRPAKNRQLQNEPPPIHRHLYTALQADTSRQFMKNNSFRNVNYPTARPKGTSALGSQTTRERLKVPYVDYGQYKPRAGPKGRHMTDVTVWKERLIETHTQI